MSRMLLLLCLLMLPALALGEDVSALSPPPALTDAASPEEVASFLLMPDEGSVCEVRRGYIRYIGQNAARDDAFRSAYWLGGEAGSELDLTLLEHNGIRYTYYSGNMCTRAAYAMALNYLGIDVTPGGMSALMNTRSLDEPYDEVSALLGVERVKPSSNVFDTMMENYLSDDSYSPVYLYLRRPNGTNHAVLVVAEVPDEDRYLVVDCNPPLLSDELCRVYSISLNKARTEIINSTFRSSLQGSWILQLHQWHLPEDAHDTE